MIRLSNTKVALRLNNPADTGNVLNRPVPISYTRPFCLHRCFPLRAYCSSLISLFPPWVICVRRLCLRSGCVVACSCRHHDLGPFRPTGRIGGRSEDHSQADEFGVQAATRLGYDDSYRCNCLAIFVLRVSHGHLGSGSDHTVVAKSAQTDHLDHDIAPALLHAEIYYVDVVSPPLSVLVDVALPFLAGCSCIRYRRGSSGDDFEKLWSKMLSPQ